MVERQLPKLDVEGSSPFRRSISFFLVLFGCLDDMMV